MVGAGGGGSKIDIGSTPVDSSAQEIQGTAGDGLAAIGNPVQIGGKDDGGLIQTLSMDASGLARTALVRAEQGANANSTPLGIAGVHSVDLDVTNQASVSVFVFADQASATDGLEIQFSNDFSNYHTVHRYSVSASIPFGITVPVVARACRVKYTNGGVAQTIFRFNASQFPIPSANNGAEANTGSTTPRNAVQIGGSDGTLLRAISTNSSGHVTVTNSNQSFHVQLTTDQLFDRASSSSLTVKYTFQNVAAASTDANIVTAVASKRIRVLSVRLSSSTVATNITFNTKPGGAGTAISETFQLGVNATESYDLNQHGHFQTSVGEGLTVTTGAGSTTGVGITYIEVS